MRDMHFTKDNCRESKYQDKDDPFIWSSKVGVITTLSSSLEQHLFFFMSETKCFFY